MKVLGIGSGRCGSMSWCYWLGGLWEPFQEKWGPDDAKNRELLKKLGGQDIVVCHRLAALLPVVLDVFPSCKFIWMRRDRVRCVESWLHMTPWFGDMCALALAIGDVPRGPAILLDTYLASLDAFVAKHLAALPDDQWREVWLENAEQDKLRVAQWLGRDDLVDKPFCHVALNPLNPKCKPAPKEYHRKNKGEFQ